MEQTERDKINCVGEPRGKVRVYLEEKCAAFLEKNRAVMLGEFQMFGLLGKEYRLGDETLLLIRGILEKDGSGSHQMQISLETIRAMEAEKEKQFPRLKIMGWAVNQPGYGTDGAWRFAGLGDQYFSGAPLFLLMDGSKNEMEFYYRRGETYEALGGYHTYLDEEATGKSGSVLERIREDAEEKAESLWKPDESTAEAVREEKEVMPLQRYRKEAENEEVKDSGQSMRMLTSLASVLLLVCLVIGMLLFNNITTLDGIQDKLETLDRQIEQIHTGVLGTEKTE